MDNENFIGQLPTEQDRQNFLLTLEKIYLLDLEHEQIILP